MKLSIKDFFSECKQIDSFLQIYSQLDCVKGVRIRSYSGPHLPTFRLNTER